MANMKYGQIVERSEINEGIYRYFEYISEEDQRKFVKNFKNQPHDEKQVWHTFRELVMGAFLSSKSFKVKYERKFGKQTPDWCILDESSNIKCIIDLFTHHIDNETEKDIEAKRKAGIMIIGYKPDKNDPYKNRLYEHIQFKANKYKELVEQNNVPYVVALYSDFISAVDNEDVQSLLCGKDGLFSQYPWMSGVLFFESISGDKYSFTYIANPSSIRSINLPSGKF
jgi:hypothetical protein